MKVEHTLTSSTKINSNDFLNLRHDTIKLEESIGKIVTGIKHTNFF